MTDSDTATGTHPINPINFTNPVQRWGQLRINNATGSELLDITVPLNTEYFDGTTFITNTDDSCTALDLAIDILLCSSANGCPPDPTQPGTTSPISLGFATRSFVKFYTRRNIRAMQQQHDRL